MGKFKNIEKKIKILDSIDERLQNSDGSDFEDIMLDELSKNDMQKDFLKFVIKQSYEDKRMAGVRGFKWGIIIGSLFTLGLTLIF